MKDKLKSMRQSGAPFAQITTRDQFMTVSTLAGQFKGPVIQYDCAAGLKACNKEGQTALNSIIGDNDPVLFIDPVTCLGAILEKAPENTVIIFLGADRYMKDDRCQQAVINCRNAFKGDGRKLLLVSANRLALPADLQNDVYLIDDPTPSEDIRKEIITQTYKAAQQDTLSQLKIKLPDLTAADIKEALAATPGLSAFVVEQNFSLSLTKEGLDLKELRRQWREAINATPGLTVDMSGSTLADVGGLENFKEFSKQIMAGRNPPTAIIRVEEIEKASAGTGYGGGVGDSSGVSQEIQQLLLTWMQEENATGLIALGPAGGGKSLASVAMGSVGNVPTITFDIGAVKGSLVGQSGQNMRQALATIKSLAGKRTFWIGTCNSLANLPPELRRRFQYGVWFFDLPSAQEREAIWKIWLKKYPEVEDVRPNDEGWTGAEIRTAVQTAYDLRCTPKDAAQWIVPVSRMAADVVEELRKRASNKYLSANKPGLYTYDPIGAQYNSQTQNPARKMNLN